MVRLRCTQFINSNHDVYIAIALYSKVLHSIEQLLGLRARAGLFRTFEDFELPQILCPLHRLDSSCQNYNNVST
jgi:hypothetical protein